MRTKRFPVLAWPTTVLAWLILKTFGKVKKPLRRFEDDKSPLSCGHTSLAPTKKGKRKRMSYKNSYNHVEISFNNAPLSII
jgi:hypothetical protein